MKLSFARIPVIPSVLAFLALLLVLCAVYRWYPWRSNVRVSGVVIDAATGEPVPNARVIVETV